MSLSQARSTRASFDSCVRTPPVGLEGVLTTIMVVLGVTLERMSSMSGWKSPSVRRYSTGTPPASFTWGA